MKKFLVIALLAFASCAYSGNTIIAIVNQTPVTLKSVQINLQGTNTQDEKILAINNHIENILLLPSLSMVFENILLSEIEFRDTALLTLLGGVSSDLQ